MEERRQALHKHKNRDRQQSKDEETEESCHTPNQMIGRVRDSTYKNHVPQDLRQFWTRCNSIDTSPVLKKTWQFVPQLNFAIEILPYLYFLFNEISVK